MQIGYTGWAILLVILTATVVVMRRIERSLAENPPVETPRTKRRLAIGVVAFVMLAVLAVTAVPDYLTYRKLIAIQQHGRRAEGIVDTIYVAGCGRSGPCSLNVRYHYRAPSPEDGRPIQLTGDEYLGPKYSDDPHFVYASTRGRVPIAYDLTKPQKSAVNFDDSVFAGAQSRSRIAHAQSGVWVFLLAIGMFLLWSLTFVLGQRWLAIRQTREQTM